MIRVPSGRAHRVVVAVVVIATAAAGVALGTASHRAPPTPIRSVKWRPPGLGRTYITADPDTHMRELVRRVRAPWLLDGVLSDGRSVKLTVEGGGCYITGTVRAFERGTSTEVRSVVLEDEVVRTLDERAAFSHLCPGDLGLIPVSVPLASPLGKRRLTGGPHHFS